MQTNSSEVDVHTLEMSFVDKVRSEMDDIMTTVETRVQDAIWTAMESLAIPKLELAMKLVNASSRQDTDSVVPDTYQKDFAGNMEGLLITVSSRINSNTDVIKIDETRGNITIEGGDMLVTERNFVRQTDRDHRILKKIGDQNG